MERVWNDYENVMDFYMQSIFHSGMLLNEHDELLNEFWRPIEFKKSKSTKLYLIGTGLLAGFIISACKKSFVPGIISTIPLGIETFKILLTKYKSRNYKQIFSSYINSLQNIFSLIKIIKQHYQTRRVSIKNLSGDTKMLVEDVILAKILKLLSDSGELIFEFILFLKSTLKQIGDIIDIGDLNFVFHISLNEDSFKINNDDNEESILGVYEKIQMAYIYVTSTFLCGVGLSFCVNEWKTSNEQFTKIFSVITPDCLQYSKNIYEKIKNNFSFITNNLQVNSPHNTMNNTKQKNTDRFFLNAVNTLRERIQTLFDIVKAVEYRLMSNADETLLRSHLEDLENLFKQCEDSLKTLQYVVYKIPSAEESQPFKPIQTEKDNEDVNVITIKHSELNENLQDEEYNLSVHGSDYSDETDTVNLEYDQLLEYVKAQKLMIRELNDELRKRNIIKQTDVAPIPAKRTRINKELNNTVLPVPPPIPTSLVTTNTSFSTPETTSQAIKQNIDSVPEMNDFLAQIRAAATCRGVEETIFGDVIISSDESNED